MATNVRKTPIPTKTYFVLDDNIIGNLGGTAISEKRTVIMTDAQAQYYLTQGVIGEKELDDKQKVTMDQVFGRPVDESVNEKHRDAVRQSEKRKEKARTEKHETESREANRVAATAQENRRTTPVDTRPKGMPTSEAQRKAQE